MSIFFIGAGGALGAMARFGMMELFSRLTQGPFPYAILTINILGGFLMGLLTGLFTYHVSLSQEWRSFLTTGMLGGFTTFSAFSLDVALLIQRGQSILALAYIMGSVVGSVLALGLGLTLARSFAA